MQLRPYQSLAKDAVRSEWSKGNRKTLLVLPTGTGKTIVFSKLTEDCVRNGERVLILAHRGELLDQAADKLSKSTGLGCAVEKAENTCLDSWFRVVVGSVQSMMRESRLNLFKKDHFDTIIVDEAHHCLSDSYQRIFSYFTEAKVLGVTATPDRGDMRNLGQFFESLAYEYTLPKAIKEGFLCPIKAQTIPLKLDLTGVGMQSGDFKAGDLGTALDPYLYQIADEMAAHCADRKTVVFLPLIKTSQKFRDILQTRGFRAAEVNGSSDDRAEVLADFDIGKCNVLCNSMLLCLDTQTEILTDKGFVKCGEMTLQHKVANWNFDGSVFFEEPKEIVKRPLGLDEHIVSIDSRTINLRVTNTHRMIVRCGENQSNWKKISAEELRNGHLLPACGTAEPFDIKVKQPVWPEIKKQVIIKTAHNLRKTGKYNYDESFVEAKRRKEEHRTLQYTQPKDLSLDDCRFVGFWIADGTRSKLQSGGVEYRLCQSPFYPSIVKWIDDLVDRLDFDFIRREREKEPKTILWSFPRGTGSGPQKRNGLFRIEPYLEKNGTELFWGLNKKQFDALVEGYWYGDGWHGQAENGMPNSITMNDTKHDWIELLCTLGSVRGWRCHMFPRPDSKNPKHNKQWALRMIKGGQLHISCKTPINNEIYKNEDVWCVRTTSKNIITRRNGYVTVMGNTEGWDCPSVDCIVVLRPTKIRPLYCLDTQTEILTKEGWKTSVDIGEEVAAFNIDTGEIQFVPAIATARRNLEADEYFCSLSGPSNDIRVTNKHRMLYDNKRRKGWKIAEADYIANLRDGCILPVAGHSKFKGIPLSDDELRFIGWVMTDGTINKCNDAIAITQGEHQTYLGEIEDCIKACGFKFTRHTIKRQGAFNSTSDSVMWTISKGKPRGRDKHLTGWGRLEPYLSKDLHPNLFDMTEEQFAVMLEAINHGDGHKNPWVSYHIGKGNKIFIERLQIMAIQRGYRASVAIEYHNALRRSDLYTLHIKKQDFVHVGSKYDGRPTWIKEHHTDEICWCVENELGTLVTRRNGKVAIVGNCQMVGRGTRLHPGKEYLLLLDFLWHTERHELCHPAHLICESEEVAQKMTEDIEAAGCPVDLEQAEVKASADVVAAREEALAKKLAEMKSRKRKLVDPLQFEMSIQAEDLSGYVPSFGWECGPPSDKQKTALEKLGILPDEIDNAGKAAKLLDRLDIRRMEGLTTPKQIRFLEGRGFQHVGTWQFETAKNLIDRIAGNGWRVPHDIDPYSYKPAPIENTVWSF
jgi:superfamily II DNA or RNA helicase